MCIQFSEQEIGEPIFRDWENGTGEAVDDPDLLELTAQLLSRDVAMWVFADTIADIYGPGEVADAVRSTVSLHLAKPLLSREQRRELHEMCANLADLDVPRLFTLSIDHIGYTLRSDPSNLRAVLNELEELPTRAADKLPPIAVFVDNLATAQPAEFRERLSDWVAGFLPRKPYADALSKIRNTQRGPGETGQRYCTIHLDPDDVDPSLCYLSVYVQHDAYSMMPLIEPDDNPYTEEEIRARIGRALNSVEMTSVHPEELRIEFFLPNSLINLSVDQWRIGMVALGVQYQVVVRSVTRLRELAGTRRRWQDKWARAQQAEFFSLAGGYASGLRLNDAVGWLTEQAAAQDPDQVYVTLIRPDGAVCLLLTHPPAPDHLAALRVALDAGIPVMLWSRSPEADLSDGLSGLPPGDGASFLLPDLPLRVLAFRRSAAVHGAGDDHLARNLTLLFDDGSRVLEPAALFRMPT
jgi:vWA-MoxR associated protein C-terminal domain/vWA-MoxR associated protein middle region 0